MIKSILDWLDHRSGIRKIVSATLLEEVPGGARWRYVWGSCLAFVFSVQLITGVLLMTAYSPSSSQAWNSVHFIQYQMDFGWLIRGLHHFGSQTMVVLIGLHMLQVVIAGAHLPPREVNWWLGIGLLSMTFGLSLTGYLLPWDQKGYWATRVATNIANNIPGIGPDIRQLLVGGEDYGNHTLTRFYALHVSILPGLLIVLLILHIIIFRRHGVTSAANQEGLVTKPENERAPGSESFWPRQAFYDMVACMIVFGIMLSVVVFGHGHAVEGPGNTTLDEVGLYEYSAKAGQRGLGANLDAAADRDTANYPARPEWYFLFLFQLLKYFEGDQVLIGTVAIPNGVMLILTILPLLGYGPFRKFGHVFGIFFMILLLVFAGGLTVKAFMDDSPDGILGGLLKNTDEQAIKKAKTFQDGVKHAEELAQRACQLAMNGTPVEGGHVLIRHDPFTTGRALFEKNCGSCHSFSANENDHFTSWTKGKLASDLGDFASEKWIRGLLTDPLQDRYFGLVKKNDEHILTGMSGWHDDIEEKRKEENWNEKQVAAQEKDFDLIAKWLAYQRKPKETRDKEDKAWELEHQKPFFSKNNRCYTCHSIERIELENGKYKWVPNEGRKNTPDLTGYGSAAWIRAMIMRPGHSTRYGKKNTMPTFRPLEGPGSELALQEFRESNPGTKDNQILHLSDVDRELIIRWMLRDYRPIFGGAPIK